MIDAALQENRAHLSDAEAKAVLCAFRIPVVPTLFARTPAEAISVAGQFGFPVTMTINAADRSHEPETIVSYARLATATAVRDAFNNLVETMRREHPGTRVDGVSITSYRERPNGCRQIIGIIRDPCFGPIITFGVNGAMGSPGDRAVRLPPLSRLQAQEMVKMTLANRLSGHPELTPPASEERHQALEDILLRLSDMACELPWLQSLELDPLIDDNVVICDARITIGQLPTDADRYAHLAIHPYPSHLEREWTQPDGQTVCIRPIRPEDAELEQAFVRALSDESKHYRFMDTLRELTPAMLLRFTQIDYDREMALIATIVENGQERQIGSARYMPKPDGKTVEFALAVADDWQKRGIGRELMSSLIDVARDMGYHAIVGDVLAMNSRMFRLTGSLGFTTRPHSDDPAVKRVIRTLDGKRRGERRATPPRAGDGGTP